MKFIQKKHRNRSFAVALIFDRVWIGEREFKDSQYAKYSRIRDLSGIDLQHGNAGPIAQARNMLVIPSGRECAIGA